MTEKRDSLGIVPAPANPAKPPGYFVEWMLDGIVSLCRLSLRERPQTAKAERDMALAFAEACWMGRRWDERLDANRVRVTFTLLAQGHRKRGDMDVAQFPGPHDFLDALPRRPNEAQQEPARDPDEGRIREIKGELFRRLNVRSEQ